MAWMAAIASLAGSAMSYMGQERVNEANLQIQQNNSAFNAEQAEANRAFQQGSAREAMQFAQGSMREQMQFQQYNADSVWQRGARDLGAAGFNPMLAFSQGGAPAPSGSAAAGTSSAGSQASAGPPGNQVNPFSANGLAAAGQSAVQWAHVGNIEADTKVKEAQEELVRNQAVTEKGRPANLEQDTDRLRKLAELYVRQHGLTNAQTDKVAAEIQTELKRPGNVDADTALKRINEVLQKHDVPRMRAEDLYFRSPVGKESPHNKYGPQSPFRLLEGLGERVINRWSAAPPRKHTPGGWNIPQNPKPGNW